MKVTVNIESHGEWLKAGEVSFPAHASNLQVLRELQHAGLVAAREGDQFQVSGEGSGVRYIDYIWKGVPMNFIELVPSRFYC